MKEKNVIFQKIGYNKDEKGHLSKHRWASEGLAEIAERIRYHARRDAAEKVYAAAEKGDISHDETVLKRVFTRESEAQFDDDLRTLKTHYRRQESETPSNSN